MTSEVLQKFLDFGIVGVCLFACGFFIYKLVMSYKGDAVKREEADKELQKDLIDANRELSKTLDKVADTITDGNRVNQEQSETNRLLVEKINDKLEAVEDKIDSINNNINKLANH